jgi:hypothetical protein
MALDANEVDYNLSDDSSAWPARTPDHDGEIFVDVAEDDIGEVFRIARVNDMDRDLQRDGSDSRLAGWLKP